MSSFRNTDSLIWRCWGIRIKWNEQGTSRLCRNRQYNLNWSSASDLPSTWRFNLIYNHPGSLPKLRWTVILSWMWARFVLATPQGLGLPGYVRMRKVKGFIMWSHRFLGPTTKLKENRNWTVSRNANGKLGLNIFFIELNTTKCLHFISRALQINLVSNDATIFSPYYWNYIL